MPDHCNEAVFCLQGKSSAVLLYGASETGKTYTVEVRVFLLQAVLSS